MFKEQSLIEVWNAQILTIQWTCLQWKMWILKTISNSKQGNTFKERYLIWRKKSYLNLCYIYKYFKCCVLNLYNYVWNKETVVTFCLTTFELAISWHDKPYTLTVATCGFFHWSLYLSHETCRMCQTYKHWFFQSCFFSLSPVTIGMHVFPPSNTVR